MKLTWKKKSSQKAGGAGAGTGGRTNRPPISRFPNLPFDNDEDDENNQSDDISAQSSTSLPHPDEAKTLENSAVSLSSIADSFVEQGNRLAEGGRYCEALGKWETAITLTPGKAVLHEQKAQVLLEIGDDWAALKAATRATELDPSWAEGWITLGRAQLNYGEPDLAIESFDRALALRADSKEARADRQTAFHLVKRRKELQSSGLAQNINRYTVSDKKVSSSTG